MVGGAIVRSLEADNYQHLVLKTSADLDLIDQSAVTRFFAKEKPDIVILAAAKVGGILANDNFRAEFLYNNLMIEANVIHSAFEHGVEKLIFLGSSCIYPKFAPQPIKEEYLLSGQLESTNEPYAIAKIAGIKLCENYFRQYGANFFSAMPTNLYGPHDNFDLTTSHVIPALIRKFHEAKSESQGTVSVWGTGLPRREFLYVDDAAQGIVLATQHYDKPDPVNLGSGEEISIRDLTNLIAELSGFQGQIRWDTAKPNGQPRRKLDTSRAELEFGFVAGTNFTQGLKNTIDWYRQQL